MSRIVAGVVIGVLLCVVALTIRHWPPFLSGLLVGGVVGLAAGLVIGYAAMSDAIVRTIWR